MKIKLKACLVIISLAALSASFAGCGKSEEDVNAERMQKALNQPRPDMSKAPHPTAP